MTSSDFSAQFCLHFVSWMRREGALPQKRKYRQDRLLLLLSTNRANSVLKNFGINFVRVANKSEVRRQVYLSFIFSILDRMLTRKDLYLEVQRATKAKPGELKFAFTISYYIVDQMKFSNQKKS